MSVKEIVGKSWQPTTHPQPHRRPRLLRRSRGNRHRVAGMPVMTSMVCVLSSRRSAFVGRSVVNRVIVRMLHQVVLNLVKNPVVEASCATSTGLADAAGNGSALFPWESVHARYHPEHHAKQFLTVLISANRMISPVCPPFQSHCKHRCRAPLRPR